MKSMAILGALVSLGLASVNANAEEVRWFCASATSACGMNNTTTATNKAIEVANEVGLLVGDIVTLFAYNNVSGGYAEKTRGFVVLSTPVTSGANLSDFGYSSLVFDYAAPPAPSLHGEGISGWFTSGDNIFIRSCGHISHNVC